MGAEVRWILLIPRSWVRRPEVEAFPVESQPRWGSPRERAGWPQHRGSITAMCFVPGPSQVFRTSALTKALMKHCLLKTQRRWRFNEGFNASLKVKKKIQAISNFSVLLFPLFLLDAVRSLSNAEDYLDDEDSD